MTKPTHPQVIIVGAGIAGLTAAWQLKKAGIQVLVLEEAETVGGRMRSIKLDDALIDVGAQFLSSAYSIIPQLITDAGLKEDFLPTSEWAGLITNGNISLVHPKRPWNLFFNHVLTAWELLRFGVTQTRLFRFQRNTPLNDITAWVKFDDKAAKNWGIKEFGKSVAEKLTETILNGFYFQSLNDSSASLVAAVTAYSVHKPQTMTLINGIGSLPQKLAETLTVHLNEKVIAIEQTPLAVEVVSTSNKYKAEHVILAVPAPIAKTILSDPDEATLTLFETPYCSTATISLLCHADWSVPTSISSVYGFLFNPKSSEKIAALTIENNKHYLRKKSGMLINVMLSNTYAKTAFTMKDEDIFTAIQYDIENILPDIYQHCYEKKLFHWPHAMPYTPVGRATHVKRYRESRQSDNRIWLAGDYLGFPWTDSAAQTGLWASNQVYKHLRFYP